MNLDQFVETHELQGIAPVVGLVVPMRPAGCTHGLHLFPQDLLLALSDVLRTVAVKGVSVLAAPENPIDLPSPRKKPAPTNSPLPDRKAQPESPPVMFYFSPA